MRLIRRVYTEEHATTMPDKAIEMTLSVFTAQLQTTGNYINRQTNIDRNRKYRTTLGAQ